MRRLCSCVQKNNDLVPKQSAFYRPKREVRTA
jgi:hypothetical protein